EVPDTRLDELAKVVHPEKVIPAIIEFVDIAGLVKGAASGEGLGNKFLANIRQCDAILQVVRAFENKDIQHVSEVVDPKSDIEVINTELILADLDTVQKKLGELEKKARANDKEAVLKRDAVKKVEEGLSQEKMAIDLELSKEEKELIKDLHLLTNKPVLYACNVAEDQIATVDIETLRAKLGVGPTTK